MKNVVTAQEMRRLDNYIVTKQLVPTILLMENAAHAVFEEIIARGFKRVLIFAGFGNNAGDGFALCRKLLMSGIDCDVALLFDEGMVSGEAKVNLNILKAAGARLISCRTEADVDLFFSEKHEKYDLLVDAIFGTGLSRDITGLVKYAVERINASKITTLAIDIPSGIEATSGSVLGTAIKADITVTLQAYKRGLLLFPGRDYAGEIVLKSIAILRDEDYFYSETVTDEDDIKEMLVEREANSHKGNFGKLLVISGCEHMRGAPQMCVAAALRAGAGLTKLLSVENVAWGDGIAHEAMALSIGKDYEHCDEEVLLDALSWATAIVIGPGMGVSKGVFDIVQRALETKKPIVVDADALNALSANCAQGLIHENTIVTPHVKEMSRLCGETIDDILADPVSTAANFSAKHSCITLLKGATTIIADPGGHIAYNVAGNAGLAKGGSGDVLSGIIGAMLAAQKHKLSLFNAARVGAYILGASAVKAMELLKLRALCATDIIDAVGYLYL